MSAKISTAFTLLLVSGLCLKAGLSQYDTLQNHPDRGFPERAVSQPDCSGLFSQSGTGQVPAGMALRVVSEEQAHSLARAAVDHINMSGGLAYLDGVYFQRSGAPWKLRQELPQEHWTLVIGVHSLKNEATRFQQPLLRVALFDVQHKEVGRWQANDARVGALSSWKSCKGQSPEAQSLRDFLGLTATSATTYAGPRYRTTVKTEPVAAPSLVKNIDWSNLSAYGAFSCDVQVEQKGRDTLAVIKTASGQSLTFSKTDTGYGKPRAHNVLFDCSSKGVRVLTESSVSDYDWRGQLLGEAQFSVQWLKNDVPRQLLKVSDQQYLLVQPGADIVGKISVETTEVPSPSKPADNPFEELQKAGFLKRLTPDEVRDIQTQYASSHSWSVRVLDWFKSPNKKTIQTDLPHAHEYWLVQKELTSLPSPRGGYSGPNGTVFFVAKGVPAPSNRLKAYRVLDLNTWSCIGETFWCPWPGKQN